MEKSEWSFWPTQYLSLTITPWVDTTVITFVSPTVQQRKLTHCVSCPRLCRSEVVWLEPGQPDPVNLHLNTPKPPGKSNPELASNRAGCKGPGGKRTLHVKNISSPWLTASSPGHQMASGSPVSLSTGDLGVPYTGDTSGSIEPLRVIRPCNFITSHPH